MFIFNDWLIRFAQPFYFLSIRVRTRHLFELNSYVYCKYMCTPAYQFSCSDSKQQSASAVFVGGSLWCTAAATAPDHPGSGPRRTPALLPPAPARLCRPPFPQRWRGRKVLRARRRESAAGRTTTVYHRLGRAVRSAGDQERSHGGQDCLQTPAKKSHAGSKKVA